LGNPEADFSRRWLKLATGLGLFKAPQSKSGFCLAELPHPGRSHGVFTPG